MSGLPSGKLTPEQRQSLMTIVRGVEDCTKRMREAITRDDCDWLKLIITLQSLGSIVQLSSQGIMPLSLQGLLDLTARAEDINRPEEERDWMGDILRKAQDWEPPKEDEAGG